jgi:hypothetical protein
MSYNPNGTRDRRRMKPPVYAPIRLDKDKAQVELRVMHTITPQGWAPENTDHFGQAAMAWRAGR